MFLNKTQYKKKSLQIVISKQIEKKNSLTLDIKQIKKLLELTIWKNPTLGIVFLSFSSLSSLLGLVNWLKFKKPTDKVCNVLESYASRRSDFPFFCGGLESSS